MRSFIEDLQRAARTLLRAPLFTFPVIATLAIAVGATATVFSVVYAVLIRALPYREPERLVWLSSVRPDRPDAPFSLPETMDYRERARTIDIAAYANWSATLATAGVAQRLQGMRISANAFQVLGVSPVAGRLLLPSDDDATAGHVVLVSHAFWQNELGGSRAAIGQTIRLNAEAYTVVGVLPGDFTLPLRDVDVVVPLQPDLDPRRHQRNSVNFLRLIGRLHDGTPAATAERELSSITTRLREEHPVEYASKLSVRLFPLHQYIVGDHRQALLVLMGCVALMLGIAFANVCGLLLVRATVKQGEVAVRRALGASGARVARQLFAEAGLLAMVGGALGAGIAVAAVAGVVRWGPSGVPRLAEARVDPTVMVVVALVAAVGTILFGFVPLPGALRTAPQTAMRASGRGQSEGRQQARTRSLFIIAQVALAVMLTAAAGSMLTSLIQLRRVELGFRPDSVFVARISLPPGRFKTPDDISRFYEKLDASLTAAPGVVGTGVTSVAPLSGLLAAIPFAVAGKQPATSREWPNANYRAVSPGYFDAIRAPILSGRGFTESDDANAAKVAIVSRALVARYLDGRNPLGQQLLVDDNSGSPRPVTIVGVLRDLRHVDLEGPPSFDIYIPMRQIHPDAVTLVTNNQFWAVRLGGDVSAFGTTFARTLKEADPDAATSGIGGMPEYVTRWLAPRRFSVALLLGFAVVAVALASFGVYGVVAYGVARRRREIGLRLALGATPGGVVGLVLAQTLKLAGIGIVLGVVGALLGGKAMAGLLFGVTPNDPVFMGTVAVFLAVTSTVASLIPAWRASRIDPSVALSAE
jgi:putative ABC transport system permease protein